MLRVRLRHFLWCFIALISTSHLTIQASSVSDDESSALPTAAEVLLLIHEYRQQPLSPQGFQTAGKIVNFTEQSKDVLVELNPDNTPWLESPTISKSLVGLMLGAYVVGNIEPQLLEKIKKARHCAGTREVAKVLGELQSLTNTLEVRQAIQLNQMSQINGNCSTLVESKKLESI